MMTTRTKTSAGTLLALAVLLLAESQASANVSGNVTGTWRFWNKNGNFCPTANGCAGARYTQAMFDTVQPISNAIIWIVNAQTFDVLGQGVSATDGTFNVQWSAATNPGQLRVKILSCQKDNRFTVDEVDGPFTVCHTAFTQPITAAFPTTSAGGWFQGNSASPDPWFNAYWAIEQEWRNVLSLVGVELNNFNNVAVVGFSNTGALGTCNTSCASGPNNSVQLDANAGFSPQARAMHEVGHIAEYVAHTWSRTMNYNWPDTSTFSASGTWNQTSGEWGAVAFEEGFATHYGSIAFWAPTSSQPTTCLTSTHCYDGFGAPLFGTDLEASSFPFSVNNCSTATPPESRWPMSNMRFIWDVFDDHNDADGDSYPLTTESSGTTSRYSLCIPRVLGTTRSTGTRAS